MAFCLSFPKWCNTYTLAEKIKALEHQTFSTHFTSKFMLFWITQKLTFFTHPNIKIGKNGNAPIHRRGFHVFFKNSWPSFTHLRPDIMALVSDKVMHIWRSTYLLWFTIFPTSTFVVSWDLLWKLIFNFIKFKLRTSFGELNTHNLNQIQ